MSTSGIEIENNTNKVIKDIFNEKLSSIVENSNDRSDYFTNDRYNQILREVQEAKYLRDNKMPLSSKHYRRLKRFDIITISGEEKLIQQADETHYENFRYYCKTEDLFDIIETAHIATGHKRTRVMENEINKKYCNVSRVVIQIYLSLCQQCQGKKKLKKKGLVVAPILSNHMNSRCQVDLIDMQTEPDREYRFIFNYQDHLTKFTILRPLKTKTAEEVAYNLIDIFCIFGAPFILQSDNGREFANRIIENLTQMWPGLKLVHGKPRHSQSQGSVERSNQDVRDMLVAWMLDNDTQQWSEGLRFVQSKKNRSLHEGIRKSPYEAMFGSKQRIGLADSTLEKQIFENLETEEDLEQVLNGIKEADKEAVENSTIVCAICEDPGILKICKKCNLNVHIKCSIETEHQVICSRCSRSESIKDQREIAKCGLEKQAKKMLSSSVQKLPRAEVGQNVLVKVPDVDRGRLAPRNVLAIVLSIHESGMYQLGTKEGVLERMYGRNEFTFADSNFMDRSEVPTTSLSLRKASGLASGSKQGFVSCHCKRYCSTKKCNCRYKQVLCNSKCHNSTSCKNK